MAAIDWGKLRRVIEAGTVEACVDSGLTRMAVRVLITKLPCGTPAITVEVLELTEEVAKAVIAASEDN